MSDVATGIRTQNKLKLPSMFKVVLINDDYTPMDFVVEVLKQIFDKQQDEAETIMLHVHTQGRGVAGIYTFEIAKQKQDETHKIAKLYKYPLKTRLEESLI